MSITHKIIFIYHTTLLLFFSFLFLTAALNLLIKSNPTVLSFAQVFFNLFCCLFHWAPNIDRIQYSSPKRIGSTEPKPITSIPILISFGPLKYHIKVDRF